MSDKNRSMIFQSELPKEEKNVIWVVKNFTAHHESKSPKNESLCLEFDAGESINRPSTWRLELRFTPTNEIGFYLKLRDDPNDKIFAAYRLSIILDPNCPNNERLLRKAPFKEYLHGVNCWGWTAFQTVDQLRNEPGALVDDTLILHVQIEILGKATVSPYDFPVCTPEIFKHTALEHYGALLRTGEGSDFVIRVKKMDSDEYYERKVHRLVLSARSPVFKAMLSTRMLETETGSVTIEDLSHKGLDILLEFIYTGNLHEDWKIVPEEMINAAEKYKFPEIKKYYDDCLHTLCTADNAVAFLNMAKTHGLKKVELFIKSNFETELGSEVSNASIYDGADRVMHKRSKQCFIL